MPQYILKVHSNRTQQETADLNLGHLSASGTTQRRAVKAQPGAIYRLVDAKTGEVVKDQSLLRKGRTLQVVVESCFMVTVLVKVATHGPPHSAARMALGAAIPSLAQISTM